MGRGFPGLDSRRRMIGAAVNAMRLVCDGVRLEKGDEKESLAGCTRGAVLFHHVGNEDGMGGRPRRVVQICVLIIAERVEVLYRPMLNHPPGDSVESGVEWVIGLVFAESG